MNDKDSNEKCEKLSSWVYGRLISGRPSFTLEEAFSASSLRRPVLSTALHRLKARKFIVSPMRGFYVGNYILNFFSCSTVPSCVLANLRKMPGEIRFACLRQDVFSGALPPRHARHSALSVGIRSHFVLPGGRSRGGSCAVNAA